MPRRPKPKYQLPNARRKSGSGGYFWLFLLLILAGGAWFWWSHYHVAKTARHRPKPAPAAPPVIAKPLRSLTVTQAVVAIPPVTFPTRPVEEVAPGPTNSAAPPVVTGFPRPVVNPFEAQVALARLAISPGSIDGANGTQTRQAIRAFQWKNHLPPTGSLDQATRAALSLDAPVMTTYIVTTNDLDRLQPLGKTWLEKSQQTALDYETEAELVGEFSHSNPALIRKLNPHVDWSSLTAGTVLQVPDVQYPDPSEKAAFVIIHLSDKFLEAFDEQTNLIAHFPCSIAAHVEKRPVGLLHVTVIIPNPNYTFDPAVFPESPEAQKIGHKLILPAGPNNPVGVAWMGLDRPGYGMHGTPAPEQVGRTESHGCFRLANWDAAYMVKLVWIGMPVEVVP